MANPLFDRRQLLQRGLAASASLIAASEVASRTALAADLPARVIDAHCHAGKGMNYGKNDPDSAPWTTFNDPERVIRQADAAGITQTIIFPISNTTYTAANEEIAGYVRRWPSKFIRFAKHDPATDGGTIRQMLLH